MRMDPYPVKATLTRARSIGWRLRTGGAPDATGTRIIIYHRVAEDDDDLAVSPQRFRQQMAFLAARGYTVVDVLSAVRGLAAEPAPRTIGLSFDDAFADVAENALPVLEEHGFRATVFVATGVASGRTSFSWYRRQPAVLGWRDMAGLDAAGTLRFEAHTVTHPDLRALDEAAAWAEIASSKEELEAHLARKVSCFAYPSGLFGDRERELVREAGYELAVTCEPGVNTAATDRFALRRRQIDARDAIVDFEAKVGGGHDTPLPLRGAYRRLRYGRGAGKPLPASSRR
jgi:peptidoglycan/xylan/chitin deacetylase (PgdA/CDA1 family)